MALRTLRDNQSLDGIWEELVFTEARLLGDEQAKEFGPVIGQLIARLEKTRGGQLGTWREEVAAQAAVSAVDDQLDDWVQALDMALLNIVQKDIQSPRYRRYFSTSPSSIIRMGLESELGRVRAWADSLATEPEVPLRELSTRLKSIIVLGDQALERRRKSGASRSDHRVRDITSLVDDVNAARASLYGALTKRAADLRLPRNWADRFFTHGSHPAKDSGQPATTEIPATVPAN